ncbi:MAG: glycosyltransferase family 2 protein [Anaerolineae bacterium]|nr:glycosyltransferase family 2 protein [Anaerolineae bacterium]
MDERPVYSIIAPVYNEEGNIHTLFERLSGVMNALGRPWELLLVNDGSRDRSLVLMQELQQQQPNVRVLSLARNFGHQIAVTAGLDYADGQAIILIDADLQDPPEIIPDMIAKWQDGFDVVYAVREQREGESWFKLKTAKVFYRLIYQIAEIEIPLDTGDFRLMDRRVVMALRHLPEHNPYIRGLTSWVGFQQTGITYNRDSRSWGETKYPLRKMLRFALDAITGFSYFPLQVAMYVSLALAFIAVLAVPVVALLRLSTGQLVFEGQATTLVVLLLLSSFQLFFFFIMGQYIARIYDEVRGRPLYVLSELYGFGAEESKDPASPQRGVHPGGRSAVLDADE